MTMYNISQTILTKIIIRNESFSAASSKWQRKDEKKLIFRLKAASSKPRRNEKEIKNTRLKENLSALSIFRFPFLISSWLTLSRKKIIKRHIWWHAINDNLSLSTDSEDGRVRWKRIMIWTYNGRNVDPVVTWGAPQKQIWYYYFIKL